MSNSRSAIIYYGGFKSAAGGAFMHATLLNEALQSIGWSSKLVTLDSLPRLFKYLPHLVLKISNFVSPTSGFLLKGKVISFLFRVFQSDNSYDLVVFEDIYLARKCNKLSIIMLHAVWSDNLEGMKFFPSSVDSLKLREARLLQSLNSPVITVSSEYESFLKDYHFKGFSLPSLSCVELGVNLLHISGFAKSPSNKNPYSLVYCGVCADRKNLFFLLDILESLVSANDLFTLTIIGDGPLLSSLQKNSDERNLPVVFKGRLDRNALLEEFSLCSVCVHTSTKESFSFSLLEAKLLGLSTVAYGGLEVPHEFIDIPVSSYSVDSWVAAIYEALRCNKRPDLSMYSSINMARRLIASARRPQTNLS